MARVLGRLRSGINVSPHSQFILKAQNPELGISKWDLPMLGKVENQNRIWTDSLILPSYFAAASALLLTLTILWTSKLSKKIRHQVFSTKFSLDHSEPNACATPAAGVSAEFREHIQKHGGLVTFIHKSLRLVGCLTLLGLTVATFVLEEKGEIGGGLAELFGKHKRRKHKCTVLSKQEWLQVAMTMTYAYASLLAIVSVTARPKLSRLVTKHLVGVLLFTFGVFSYRDLWPLATVNNKPLDLSEGSLIWAKMSVLALAGVVIPLSVPREYIPCDPKDPNSAPTPEQTASVFSFAFYFFLDPIIRLAYKMPHLSVENLPPIADYDRARNLKSRNFPYLDPFAGAKKRYLFWKLLLVFRREYSLLTLLIILKIVFDFASPVGINRLLNYLETGGAGENVRPWVWILWLFVGPLLGSICWQLYIFINTRNIVRTQSMLTQLVFEHALRIRMKAEAPESKDELPKSVQTPDNAWVAENASETSDETLNSSSASVSSSANTNGSTNGKKKTKDAKEKKKEGSSADNLVGKINNLVTTDIETITDARDFLFLLVQAPLVVAFSIAFLYLILGWSSFVGLAAMVILLPVPSYIGKQIQTVQQETMKKTDARAQSVTETMNVLRMVKLFGWEPKMADRIAEKREAELKFTWKKKLLNLVNGNVNFLIPVLTMIASYTTYTVIMKRQLTASKVFSSMSVFDLMRDQLHTIFWMLSSIIQGKVSIDRMDDYLNKTELLDSYAEKAAGDVIIVETQTDPTIKDKIGFNNAHFTWSSDRTGGSLTPSKQGFTLRIENELVFKRGGINLIIGPTGSGKTSVLMALLGEMHFVRPMPDSWYNLPREAGIAYAAQESWVQNETIKDNIVFGNVFDEERYKKVIYQCALERDIALFDAGDKTEVGEKGLTLSGGQKARLTLARAIYSKAEIILMDDVLAALDVHTSRWIVDKCLSGDLVKDRTVILVTHNVALTSPIADFVVSLGTDGRIQARGTVSEVLSNNASLIKKIAEEKKLLEKAEHQVDGSVVPAAGEAQPKDGKLIVKEEIAEGHISLAAVKLYTAGMSGNHIILFWSTFVGAIFFTELVGTIQVWFLGYWAGQYEKHPAEEVKVNYYLSVYTALQIFAVLCYCVGYTIYYIGTLRASREIHQKLVSSVLGTTLRWLDTTPVSRVIARCTQDIRAIDGMVPDMLGYVLELTVSMIIKLGAVVYVAPIFLFPGAAIAAIGGWMGQVYMGAQLSVKREMSNARAPVIGHFGAAIAGLTSIRAYGVEEAFKRESMVRIDKYTRTGRTFYNLNRWISIRVDVLGGLFSSSLAAYLVYYSGKSPSDIGFSLTMAVGFSSMILWWVRLFNDFEISGNSLERILDYLKIEQEPKATEGGIPPAHWPSSGDLVVEGLSARYSPDGPKVLHDISFKIKSGERVGVVGRTGSGKSSLTLSLLRCIYTEGTVYYDGIPTSSLNLDALRSSITIIPQVPELLSGTLRENLDPFSHYDDVVLNSALRAAGLYSLQGENDDRKITLDTSISGGGGNLSVGQRQILALARAIVRGSKLLILDEATSAIDYKTDSVIQSSLRNELGSDVTIITVAHRLQTIMDADRIMVLDAGRISEFGSPKELLGNQKGMLRSLVDESDDKDVLLQMADK